MFDPTLIDGLQRVLAPPTIMPPAIERAWVSPDAERGERIVGPWLDGAEQRAREWRSQLLNAEDGLDGIASMVWDAEEVALLDNAIATGSATGDKVERWADAQRRQGLRGNKLLDRVDPSAAAVHRRHIERFAAMHRENIAALRRLLVKLRAYRSLVDPRTGAEPGYEPKPWTPNTATANAMREAIDGVGMRRVGSVAEMMAELHAEGD